MCRHQPSGYASFGTKNTRFSTITSFDRILSLQFKKDSLSNYAAKKIIKTEEITGWLKGQGEGPGTNS